MEPSSSYKGQPDPEPGDPSGGRGSQTYPQAPWRLQGPWLVAPSLIDLELARSSLPAGLEVVPVQPGKTLGGLLLADYRQGSTLLYHELIAFSGLARAGARIGLWISHIYVDNQASITGGRQMWGLPKEWADFIWQPGQVRVSQAGRSLVDVLWQPGQLQAPLPLLTAAFGGLGGLHWFWGWGWGKLRLVQAQVRLPVDSPLSGLGLEHPLATLAGGRVTIHLGGIRTV